MSTIKEDYQHAAKVQRLCAEFGSKQASPEIIKLLTPVVEAAFEQNTLIDGAFLNLSMALRRMDRFEEYAAHADRAYAIDPYSLTTVREKIHVLSHRKSNDEIHRVISKLEELPERKTDAVVLRAQQFRNEGNIAEALRLMEDFIANNTITDGIVYNEAGILARTYNGDLSKSIAYFAKGVELDPTSHKIRSNYAVSLADYADCIAETDPESALELREKALQVFEGSPDKTKKENFKLIAFLSDVVSTPGVLKIYNKSAGLTKAQKERPTGILNENLKQTEHEAAKIAKAKGDKEAITYMMDAMKAENYYPPSLLEKTSAYALRTGYFALAEKLLDLSLSSSTRSQSLHLKAILLTRTGREVEAFKVAEKLYSIEPHNKDGALMYAIGMAVQERYVDMLHIVQPFLDRMKSGRIPVASAYEFIALKAACMGKDSAAEFKSDFDMEPHIRHAIKNARHEYRKELRIPVVHPVKPDLIPFTPWEQRLAKAYKTSRFWDMGYAVPIDRVAARVAYTPSTF